MAVYIEISLDQIALFFRQMEVDFGRVDWSRTHSKIALVLESMTKRNFDRGESPDGVPWAPLKRPRARSKGNDLPLRDTGLLMASYSAQGEYHVQASEGDVFRWGSNLDYAPVHQFGTDRRPDGTFIPARPHVGLNEETIELIELVILDEAEAATQ